MTSLYTDTLWISCYIAGLCLIIFPIAIVIAIISLAGLVVGWVYEVVR